MSIPQTSDSIGNVLRLSGLKNVSGRRRVLPGAEFLQDLDNVNTDVSGASSDMAETNLPEIEMGGELTPQSYDIRANQATPPNAPSDDEGLMSRFGKAMAMQSQMGRPVPQTPPIETQQVDLQEGIPPVSASQQVAAQPAPAEEEPGVFERFGKWFKKGWTPSTPEEIKKQTERMPPTDLLSVPPILKNTLGLGGLLLPDTFGSAEKQQEWNDYREDEALRDQGLVPEEARAQKSQEMLESVQKAIEQPWEFSAYGAGETVANDPILKEQFKEITGIDYEPEIAAQEAVYESAMKGVEDSLNGIQTDLTAQEEQIKQRILNNQATDADKFYIGLALLMPLIVGGIFGKEAGLGALGGTGEAFANILTNRDKNIRTDESALADLSKQKAGNAEKLGTIALNRAQIRPTIQKNLPKNPLGHLEGRQGVDVVNPETGKTEKAVRILPDFIAKQEYVSSEEGLKNMQKAAGELSEVKNYTDELNDLTDDIIYISSQLKDGSDIGKLFTSVINKTTPGSLGRLTQDVEFEGRKVNAGLILAEKLGFLANAYAQARELGQLDRAAQSHIEKIMLNPTSTLATGKDAIDQMLEVRKLAQRGLIRSAANKGFYPQFLQQQQEEKNNALFNRLNQGEQGKRLEEVKKKMSRSGTTYAK
jgi:hypothetical protein